MPARDDRSCLPLSLGGLRLEDDAAPASSSLRMLFLASWHVFAIIVACMLALLWHASDPSSPEFPLEESLLLSRSHCAPGNPLTLLSVRVLSEMDTMPLCSMHTLQTRIGGTRSFHALFSSLFFMPPTGLYLKAATSRHIALAVFNESY